MFLRRRVRGEAPTRLAMNLIPAMSLRHKSAPRSRAGKPGTEKAAIWPVGQKARRISGAEKCPHDQRMQSIRAAQMTRWPSGLRRQYKRTLISERPDFLEDCMAAKQVNPFYRSRAWKIKRKAILRRDGYLCKLSRRYGKTCPAETVHHIYPLDLYPEHALCEWNLISVSSEMHNRLHNREDGSLSADGEALMRVTIPPLSD
jgi:hypothetical protein